MIIPGANEKIAGMFYDVGGAVRNLLHPQYRAIPNDDAADNTGPINDWYADIPTGGTGLIPGAFFRHTRKLSFNRNVNILGTGPGSSFKPSINASTDALVFNDNAESDLYRIRLDNFSILNNAADCCRNGIVFNRCHQAEVNVVVLVAAAHYGVVISGCLEGEFRVVSSVNGSAQYPYPGAAGRTGAVIVTNGPGGMPVNACKIVVFIEGGGNGVWVEDHRGQGNNEISGTIEGTRGGRAFYAKGCAGLDLHNLHLETNAGIAELDHCTASSIGPSVRLNGAGNAGNLTLTACDGIQIDNTQVDSLSVDAACSNIFVGNGFHYGGSSGIVADPALAIKWADATAMSMPGSGTYFAGQYVAKRRPAIAGSAGRGYVVKGWVRLTTGSSHLLNIDWAEDWVLMVT